MLSATNVNIVCLQDISPSQHIDDLVLYLPSFEQQDVHKYLVKGDKHAALVSRLLQRSIISRYTHISPDIRIPRTSQVFPLCFQILSVNALADTLCFVFIWY